MSAQGVEAPTISSALVANGINSATHLSCDGLEFNSGSENLKVFAWDGADEGWTYDYMGTVASIQAYDNSGVSHPEIALVSIHDGTYIYAIAVYDDNISGAYYEAYLWGGSSFPSTPAYSGNFGSFASLNVINVAGDNFGNFIIVCDDASITNHIEQLTGYIDIGSSGALQIGTWGDIELNPTYFSGPPDIWEPDADVTWYRTEPLSAMIYLVFNSDNGLQNEIKSASIRMDGLFQGTTWSVSPGEITSEITDPCDEMHHPSISVSDGLIAETNNVDAHAAIAFMSDCFPNQYISMYPVTAFSSTSTITVLNQATYTYFNTEPTAATLPEGPVSTVAWNLDVGLNLVYNLSSGQLGLDGLAHPATFDDVAFEFDDNITPGQDDLQVNDNGLATVFPTTVSCYSAESFLYFYFDFNNKDLWYKTAAGNAYPLRKELTNASIIKVYPNPAFDRIYLQTETELEGIVISDVLGKQHLSFKGSNSEIEKTINEIVPTLKTGTYFMQTTDVSGAVQNTKFQKQ
ncbi:MAG: T9SS type A sorting domain-containing protein [Bacteroidota bacterium]